MPTIPALMPGGMTPCPPTVNSSGSLPTLDSNGSESGFSCSQPGVGIAPRRASISGAGLPSAIANLLPSGLTPPSTLPGAILLAPLIVWVVRRAHGLIFPDHPIWGVERPALEIWTAILAFAPAVGWLGNPAWWRETLPRMAHYYQLSADRRGALPDIRIMYFGDIYIYSLPWHNAWVLIAITVAAADANCEQYILAMQPGGPYTATPGGEIPRIQKQRGLPNAFGFDDIFGRKVD